MLQGVLLALGGALLAGTLLSLAAPAAWWLDLLTHLRPQLALGLLAVACLQLLVGPRPLAGAWVTGAFLNVYFLAPLLFASAPAGTGTPLAIVHANVGHDQVDADRLAAWIARDPPDLVLLQEVTPGNLPRIERALSERGLEFMTLAAEARQDTRGVALLARLPGVSAGVVRPTPDPERPMVQAHLELDGKPVAILGFHTTRPAPGRHYRFQAEGMASATLWCRAQEVSGAQRLLIGDFNSTSQGVLVKGLCQRAKLRDARRGIGIGTFEGTWPASLPAPLRVPIDGAYHSQGLAAEGFEVGPAIGGDHRPIRVTLRRATE